MSSHRPRRWPFGPAAAPPVPLPATGFAWRLPGGVTAWVRPIEPADSRRFRAGWKHLSEPSRRLRFFGQVSELSRQQLAFLTHPDGVRHVAWGALDAAHPDVAGMGVGRMVRASAEGPEAEVAITVLDAWQSRGVGLLLHAVLHLEAARLGIERLHYDVHFDNARFVHHLRELGARPTALEEVSQRLTMAVLRGPGDVPTDTAAGRRLFEVMTRLVALEGHPARPGLPPSPATAVAPDDHLPPPGADPDTTSREPLDERVLAAALAGVPVGAGPGRSAPGSGGPPAPASEPAPEPTPD